jgi:hypothetical protein
MMNCQEVHIQFQIVCLDSDEISVFLALNQYIFSISFNRTIGNWLRNNKILILVLQKSATYPLFNMMHIRNVRFKL